MHFLRVPRELWPFLGTSLSKRTWIVWEDLAHGINYHGLEILICVCVSPSSTSNNPMILEIRWSPVLVGPHCMSEVTTVLGRILNHNTV